MVVVPAGSFTMGAPLSERMHQDSEAPRHTVTITRPFAVGRFAVTFAEWDACAENGGCGGEKPGDHDWGRDSRPVINVSWDDANAYVTWLSQKTGKSYRLLSEAEREYVTRAGTDTPFWWGSQASTDRANYNGGWVYDDGVKGEFRRKTLPVQSLTPNPWGLYQVHGNVWEWTEDCWNRNYDGAPTDGSAWTAGTCVQRVLRGGSWDLSPANMRSACRYSYSSFIHLNIVGFRVARILNP
jgi:formylglycine-generating enzyme required for sulfatase activity